MVILGTYIFHFEQVGDVRITSDHYLVRDIIPPNHQPCFPLFFPRIFLSKKKQVLDQ